MFEIIAVNDDNAVKAAVAALESGRVICFKSDTVYALACDAADDLAIERIYEMKSRNQEKPIAIYVKDMQMARMIFDFDEKLLKLCENYLPGYLTVITKKSDQSQIKISRKLNVESKQIGFRIVADGFVNKIMSIYGAPLAVTSANLSGSDNVKNVGQIKECFADHDLLVIDSGDVEDATASTVISYKDGKFYKVRLGKLILPNEIFN